MAQSADIHARLESVGVRCVSGQARLSDEIRGLIAHRVEVCDFDGGVQQEIECDVVLIATGADPRVLPGAEPDGERILSWRDVYELEELPEHLVVVGSGVTGAEFASGYLEAGVPVTLVSSRDQVLPGEDADAAAVVEQVFQSRGGKIAERGRAESVKRTATGVEVMLTDGRVVTGSHALMTVGTVPNTGGLNLEKCGVATSPSGHVVVDRVSRTSVSGIYAAGDVTGVFQLASVAAMQGRIAMWHALGEAVSPIRLKTVAGNVFTHPEIATVGVQEKTLPEGIGHRQRAAAAGDQRPRQDERPAGRVREDLRPPLHRRRGRRRGRRARRLGAGPADHAGGQQGADRRRPGADVLHLPVAVGLDHRGRTAVDDQPGRLSRRRRTPDG